MITLHQHNVVFSGQLILFKSHLFAILGMPNQLVRFMRVSDVSIRLIPSFISTEVKEIRVMRLKRN